ncbi:hypothetical protein BDW72DRAFT_198873 [Aspergillus terricola var. indicus]
MANAKFYLFLRLPLELRLQIWHDALPAGPPIESTVFSYRKGCWGPRHLTPGDPEYDPMHEELNLNFEFDHTLLDPIEIELPLVHVNHEARSVALEWARKQNLQGRFTKRNSQLLFLRPFNADTDTIYVSRSQWHDFIREPMERPFEPDLIQRQLGCPGVPFSRLALDDWILCHEPNCLAELFDYYYTIETVFVVTRFRSEGRVDCVGNDVNNSNSNSNKANTRQWREVESTPVLGPTLYWDADSRSFQWKDIAEVSEENAATIAITLELAGKSQVPLALCTTEKMRYERCKIGQIMGMETDDVCLKADWVEVTRNN